MSHWTPIDWYAFGWLSALGFFWFATWLTSSAPTLHPSDERGLSDAEQAEIAVHHERGRWE
jgi:hypothetical protein